MQLTATRLNVLGSNRDSSLPPISTLAIFGTSSIEEHHDFVLESGALSSLIAEGHFMWACGILKQQVQLAHNMRKGTMEFGWAGRTNADILTARLPQVVEAAPSACLLLMNLNDLSSGATDAAMVAQTLTAINTLKAANIIPIVSLITPRNSAAIVRDGKTYSQLVDATNAAIAAMCDANKVQYFDPMPFVADPVTRNWLPQYDRGDGTHTSAQGAQAYAAAFVNWLRSKFSFPENPFITAIPNLKGGNPFFAGGTNIATGWALTTPTGTAIASKVAASDGGNNWQQIVYSPVSWTDRFTLSHSAVALPAGISPRDRVRLWAEIETGAGVKATTLEIQAIFNNSATVKRCGTGSRRTPVNVIDRATIPTNGVYMGPEFIVPVDATTVAFQFQANGAGTYRIRNFGLERIETADNLTTGTKILIDVGRHDTQTTGQPEFWNNFFRYQGSADSVPRCRLRTTTGQLTSAVISLPSLNSGPTGIFAGQTNNKYPVNAKNDGFTGFGTGSQQVQVHTISNLDPAKRYKLTFFGTSNVTGSVTRYRLTESPTTFVDLGTHNNDQTTVSLTNVAPNARGEIRFEHTAAPSNTATAPSGHHIISVLEIEVE